MSRSTVRRRGEGAPLEAMMGQRDRSLRQYLMAYGAALLVPVLLLAVVLVWQFARAEEVQNEEKARAAAQQIIAAVDRELAGLQAAGLALASSAALRAGNFERVQRRAAEIIRALPHPQNYAIVVRDLTGQQLVNTRVPWGTPLPKGADPDADKEVIETRLPFVQDLFTGATANRPVLSVRVPVLADESVTHVLSVAFEPAHIAGIIGEQNLPTAWTATVLDRNSRVIARSQNHAQYLGIVPAEGFGAAEARENRAWRGISLEGEPVLGAFAQSKLSGWRAFVGVPERVVQAPLWRSLWLIAALAAVLLAISFLLAFWFGRRIARPIQRLAREARALGRGQPVHAFASGVREPDLVSAAMAAAHQELAAREAALRASEGRLRATAENAAVGIVEVDRDGRFLRVNEAQCRLTGHSREELIGRHFAHATRPDFMAKDLELFERQAKGELDVYTLEKPHVRTDGTVGWARISSTAVRGPAGEFQYAVRVIEDISERKRSEERQQLLLHELNHRVKNTLTTVQSLAWQTLQPGKPLELAREQFQARLLALSRTHNLLNEAGWHSAQLVEIIRAELEPYQDQSGGRYALEGEDIALPPRTAVALGMTLHEMTTNSAKHGALSAKTGAVTVRWRIRPAEMQTTLDIEWLESGGPVVAQPLGQGFGSRLIKRLIESELAGRVALDFCADGLRASFAVPLGDQPGREEVERAA
ncbi:MAG: PAS domain S-box protein [Microvirga sp.]